MGASGWRSADAQLSLEMDMNMGQNLFNARQEFTLGNGQRGAFYSVPALEKAGLANISRLPVSIRIVLESVLRNFDGKRISEQDVRNLASWQPKLSADEQVAATRVVESGGVLYFPRLPFVLEQAELQFLSPAWCGPGSKNISLDQSTVVQPAP